MVIKKLFDNLLGSKGKEEEVKTIELPEAKMAQDAPTKTKVLPIVVNKFQDTERILDYLRTGEYILLLNVRPLRDKDITELKRSINRLKTHCEATNADIAALDDNWILLAPKGIHIERANEE